MYGQHIRASYCQKMTILKMIDPFTKFHFAQDLNSLIEISDNSKDESSYLREHGTSTSGIGFPLYPAFDLI